MHVQVCILTLRGPTRWEPNNRSTLIQRQCLENDKIYSMGSNESYLENEPKRRQGNLPELIQAFVNPWLESNDGRCSPSKVVKGRVLASLRTRSEIPHVKAAEEFVQQVKQQWSVLITQSNLWLIWCWWLKFSGSAPTYEPAYMTNVARAICALSGSFQCSMQPERAQGKYICSGIINAEMMAL